MQPREKNLMLAVIGIGGCLLVFLAVQAFASLFSGGNPELAAAQKAVESAKKKLADGKKIQARVAELQQRSLPRDKQDKLLAGSVYQYWLTDQIDRAHLKTGADLQPQPPLVTKDGYTRYLYTLTVSGNLEQITNFLHGFYSADHLHKITTLNLKPTDGGKQIAMRAIIEAISLDDAAAADKLNAGVSSRLRDKELAVYTKAIVERNPFGPWVPPIPPKPTKQVVITPPKPVDPPPKPVDPGPPPFDHAKLARVTSVFQTGKGSEVFIRILTTDEILKLKAGEEFKVGSVKGTVTKITQQGMEFSSEGKLKRVELGKSLADATPILETAVESPSTDN